MSGGDSKMFEDHEMYDLGIDKLKQILFPEMRENFKQLCNLAWSVSEHMNDLTEWVNKTSDFIAKMELTKQCKGLELYTTGGQICYEMLFVKTQLSHSARDSCLGYVLRQLDFARQRIEKYEESDHNLSTYIHNCCLFISAICMLYSRKFANKLFLFIIIIIFFFFFFFFLRGL